MLPQPLRPDDEPPLDDLAYPSVRWRRPRFATRGRVLRFALLAGCGWAAVLALATAVVMSMFPVHGIIADRSSDFLPTFFQLFAVFAPMLIVAAALAAGTQAVLREMRRSATKSRRALEGLVKRAGDQRNSSDSRGPLPELDLEIDRPRP
ncbi:MAG: hypothetical protein FJ271_11755 [Planctomycetes bacterium]|nr:hypothetical protein [Planctomycetota bacterium]